jgi:hypothetical protein
VSTGILHLVPQNYTSNSQVTMFNLPVQHTAVMDRQVKGSLGGSFDKAAGSPANRANQSSPRCGLSK